MTDTFKNIVINNVINFMLKITVIIFLITYELIITITLLIKQNK